MLRYSKLSFKYMLGFQRTMLDNAMPPEVTVTLVHEHYCNIMREASEKKRQRYGSFESPSAILYAK